MPRVEIARLRGEYGNRVQIPDGTAAVSAESPRHIPPVIREGDGGSLPGVSQKTCLSREDVPTDYGLGVGLRRETAAGIFTCPRFFVCADDIDAIKRKEMRRT